MRDRVRAARPRRLDRAVSRTLDFRVLGMEPAKQGDYVAAWDAKTGRTWVRPKEDARNQRWRKEVRAAARDAMHAQEWPLRNGAWVKVIADLYFDRPANQYGTGANADRLKDTAPPYPSAPDTDKLQRALGDALQMGEVIANDRLIVDWHARRLWTPVRGRVGAVVRIVELTDHEQLTLEETP